MASLDGAKGAAAAATGSSELFARRAFDADDADTTAFFRRLLILWPSSSSEDVKLESESASGGGDSGFLRKFPFFTERFLKETGGAASAILRLYTGRARELLERKKCLLISSSTSCGVAITRDID